LILEYLIYEIFSQNHWVLSYWNC